MANSRKVVVTGAGGFIGHHLVTRLVERGDTVIGVDLKRPEFSATQAAEFVVGDLRELETCLKVTKGADAVYNLAADMGGIGYTSTNLADLSVNNIWINSKMLHASRVNEVGQYFFSSTACIYPTYRQESADVPALKESDAMPADPDEGYGWEKIFTEMLCEYFGEDHGMDVRVARFHNVYGPDGTYDGGKEKAPAALCRKIALAKQEDEIEVWGDGEQTRSFMYIDDCLEGVERLARSDYTKPINLGSDRLVTINELVDIIAAIAGKTIHKKHDLTKPQGVRGRNSDNTLIKEVLGWAPNVSLEEGLKPTYRWIAEQLNG